MNSIFCLLLLHMEDGMIDSPDTNVKLQNDESIPDVPPTKDTSKLNVTLLLPSTFLKH